MTRQKVETECDARVTFTTIYLNHVYKIYTGSSVIRFGKISPL